MRIPSGKTDIYMYFVAVDSADLKTRETGLSSFTVQRSRNGAAEVAYTTPTITEIDATNMPGVYALLIDEDTTIASTSDSEEYCLHITQASMAPVTRVIELYRRDTTSGQTATVTSGGVTLADGVSHGGTLGSSTATLALSRASIASQSANTVALTITGNGTGDGVNFIGGADGNGFECIGGATSGNGIFAWAQTDGRGFVAHGNGATRPGIEGRGGITSHGIRGIGGATSGHGMYLTSTSGDGFNAAGGTAGHGISAAGAGAGDGMQLTAGGTGVDFDADMTGNITGNVSGSVGSVTGAVGSVTGAVGSVTGAVGSVTGAVGSVTGNVGGNVTGSVGSVVGLTAANLDATVSSRASAADLATVAGYLDTEIAAILADTNELQVDWVNGGRLDLLIDAIKAKTDSLTFTTANRVDSQVFGMQANTVSASALAADAVDEILDEVIEGTTTLRQMLRGYASALLSKASGLETTTAIFRDIGDTKPRITATVDADGNRTAITLDLT